MAQAVQLGTVSVAWAQTREGLWELLAVHRAWLPLLSSLGHLTHSLSQL